MYQSSGVGSQLLLLHIGVLGPYNALGTMISMTGTAQVSSASWPAANRALYFPMYMPSRFTVARFLTANQNATGNTDIGIYNANGSRLLSTGTTARSGAPAVQYIGVTDQSFPAGAYYLGMVCSSTSSSFLRSTLAANFIRACGGLQEDLGATTLPVTMTPAAFTSGQVPIFGFSQSDTL